MSKHLKNILLIFVSVVIGFFAADNIDNNKAYAGTGTVEVKSVMVFGPAPITVGDSMGRYMWVIAEIKNNIGEEQEVTLRLNAHDAPLGCDEWKQLILPGRNPITMVPYESRWTLWRIRYECQAPSYPGIFPLDVVYCVSGTPTIDCKSRTKSLLLEPPPTEYIAVGSGIKTAWFIFCLDWPVCLPPWPIDWSAFSYHWTGFLGGSPDAIYLDWFSHGGYIYDFNNSGRPFDLYYSNPETRITFMWCYGCGPIYYEEELGQYTTSQGCGDFIYPSEDRMYCRSGDVRKTYIDPEFRGNLYLWCDGPLGSDCLGVAGIEYTYHY